MRIITKNEEEKGRSVYIITILVSFLLWLFTWIVKSSTENRIDYDKLKQNYNIDCKITDRKTGEEIK